MDGTFKVYLSAEQWSRVCAHDEEIKAEVCKQQPALAATFEASRPDKADKADKNHAK